MDDTIQRDLIRLGHKYSALNFRKIQELGIHPGQLPVLMSVEHQEGISQTQLAKDLHVKPPTVAVTVKRLEKAGIIRREDDENDKRITRIYLTPKGREITHSIAQQVEENERILMNQFSDQEKEQLKEFFDRMVKNLENIKE